MRKLLMPTLGDMGQPSARARDQLQADYRNLLPKSEKPKSEKPRTTVTLGADSSAVMIG